MSLTGSCALMMTGFGIATPVFARRLSEFGAGVEVLSLMAMASALAQFLLAPFMGALADRFGRRPIALFALLGLAITNLAFLVVRSTEAYIVLRFLQGAFSVGMLPAAMGLIADLVPEQHRTRWVAVIMSGYAVGFTFGPVIGGFLFERGGFIASFGVSALLDLLALFVASVMVPETREAAIHHAQQREKWQELSSPAAVVTRQHEFTSSFPRPRSFFAALLAGLGNALIAPRLGASYLDISVPQHRSVVQGLRESAVSLGAVAGPLLASCISHWLAPQGIFTIAAVTTLAAVVLALVVLKPQGQAKASTLADATFDTGGWLAAPISTTRTMVEVAQAMHESASRLTATEGDVVCALHRATSPFASQGEYNDEGETNAIERVAA